MDFNEMKEQLKVFGIAPAPRFWIKIPDAKNVLAAAMNYFVNGFTWIPEYDQVAEWLSDNKGRGLLLYGTNGTGKTILVQKAIPAIMLKYCNRVVSLYNYSNLNTKADEIMSRKILSIDDIGCENEGVIYGNRRWVFPEVMDTVEKHGHLILLSTNLTGEDISAKYGIRTLERIIATTKRIKFNREDSFRK